MEHKNCAVVANELRDDKCIQSAMLNHQSRFYCQFASRLPPKYEYKSEYFCILHLPFSEKKKDQSLDSLARDELKNELSNNTCCFILFRFVKYILKIYIRIYHLKEHIYGIYHLVIVICIA